MNFFESQDRVRKNTFQLALLFALAVISLIVMTNLLVMVVFGYINSEQLQDGGTLLQQMDWQTFAAVSIGVGVVVLAGSMYKIMALSAGGKVVAEALGGQLIPQNTDDLKQRKLLNVVEEMAIASGTPPPPVYLLADELGINAFAAGFSPRDAVIGVTRGTIDHLSREQLQGVIAHEFSHIFNGDMRLNIRLIGVLNGILILGIAGYYMLYATSFSRRGRSNGKGAGGILALAIGLMVIGYVGTFFGGLIKAAVSRQREYLADASAVQFTRNPDGIAGALKRIGGLEFGSKLENPAAQEASHAFFAQGVTGFMQGLAATHPPLAKRILRIDPQWDGKFDKSDKIDSPEEGGLGQEEEVGKKDDMTRKQLAKKMATVVTGVAITDVANAIDQIGNPQPETIDHARSLISELPIAIKQAAREPYGARAVIYSLVLDSGQVVRGRQLTHLQASADPDVFVLTQKLLPELDGLDIKFRLPLIDIAIPALKQLSLDQYRAFRDNLIVLIEMDSQIDLLEWSLQKILFNHLDGQFFKRVHTTARYSHLGQLKQETELILSVLAYAGQQNKSDIEAAFSAAVETLEINELQLTAKNATQLSALDRALQELEKLNPLAKQQLLKACAASIVRDQKIAPVEIELLRAFADALGCPMPPIVLSPQPVTGSSGQLIDRKKA
ncbi:M48 family metallopeptidase [uncultured Halopseudomonas sp.]|uniref:M48 family metallopeptidase n=1 Tax=uncultured Halopseudomonas sp. TaxID=2901193 RepID=UPI0030EE9383|tara:strand:- start:2565 stop:4574 length:2010 start_codon:yes stop_codon:yes gene_type:complete